MRLRTLILFCLAAALASAAAIDGKWTSEIQVRAGKKAGGQPAISQVTLQLKSNGDQLTGTVVTAGPRRERTAQITSGKIEGNHFSFTTVQKNKKGEQRLEWQGTLDGDTLQGTRGREGRRGQPFTAKRA